MGLLDGKVTIITGAGGGLGRAYALLFAREGARVVVNDLGGTRDGSGGGQAMADEVVAEIREAGGEAVANHASVADEAGAQSIVDDAMEAFGRVDVVVNNAGILRDKTLHKLTAENFDLVMAVHARGSFLVTQAATKAMVAQGEGGVVISTSSIAGLKGNFGQTNYACAKAGIAGMTRTWATELQRFGIRSNAIAPMAQTRMTEDIAAVPEDFTAEAVAPMALFLASDLSSDVNGRIFGVHGPHVFEYHMVLSPGVDLSEGSWTATDIAERLGEIGDLPAPEAAGDSGEAGGSVRERVAEVFGGMTQIFDPDRAGDWSSVLCFDITGTGQWTVEVAGGECTVSEGRPDAAKCTIVYDAAETFLGTTSGEINPQQAFMAGKIKADNIADVMKFSQCFDMKKAAAMRAARGSTEPATPAAQVAKVFEGMAEVFDPDRAGDWSSVLCFDITGSGTWTVRVSDGV
ncbi:MAG: hydroxysteroid dehydrogenase-like protein 2, partial [Myxococcota bacterium]|nr:hydroxysteroid dehydrogenase-like protein 2 [Myxococcota bacterium]